MDREPLIFGFCNHAGMVGFQFLFVQGCTSCLRRPNVKKNTGARKLAERVVGDWDTTYADSALGERWQEIGAVIVVESCFDRNVRQV